MVYGMLCCHVLCCAPVCVLEEGEGLVGQGVFAKVGAQLRRAQLGIHDLPLQ